MPIDNIRESKSGKYRIRHIRFVSGSTENERILEAIPRLAILWDANMGGILILPYPRLMADTFQMALNASSDFLWRRCTHWPLTDLEWWVPGGQAAAVLEVLEVIK